MGSVCPTAETIGLIWTEKGEKVGVVTVHIFRPFSAKYFFDVLPSTVRKNCCTRKN